MSNQNNSIIHKKRKNVDQTSINEYSNLKRDGKGSQYDDSRSLSQKGGKTYESFDLQPDANPSVTYSSF